MTFLERADAIARKIERFVGGSGPSDPLYISNRTVGQKARLVLLIGTPVLAIVGLMGLALGNYFDPAPSPQRAAAAASREAGTLTAKVLPDLQKTYKSESDSDCEVSEASVGDGTLAGKLHNNTDHIVHVADVVFDLTDEGGSALGAVAVKVENIAPGATANFRMTVEQRQAKTALVRELHTR
jgi:hypothetical protein